MTVMSGLHFYRALAYAQKAVPTDEASSSLQHVAFIGNKVIGADGSRWHVGILDEDVDFAPMTVARGSIAELLLGLEYCRKVAKRHSGTFQVQIEDAEVRIEYGARQPIIHELAVVNLGPLPKQWCEPVGADAPELAGGASDIRCGHMQDAMKWHRSWEEDFGTFRQRGAGGNEPVRLDVTAGGELVAVAFLLPVNHPPAQLPLDDGLFADKSNPKSQSILDLDLSADGRIDPGARTIKVGDIEINATGLEGDLDDYLVEGPCKHRDDGACPQCTEDKVKSAQRAAARARALEDDQDEEEEGDEAPKAKKKAPRKSAKGKKR